MDNLEKNEDKIDGIPESKAARWAYHLALVPILGLFLYMFAAFIALYRIGQGRTGFFWLRKGFWRMLRMTSVGLIGLAICWFCPRMEHHLLSDEWIVGEVYGEGYLVRNLSYPAEYQKMWRWIYYSLDGKKTLEGNYWLGKKQGKWTAWWPCGKKCFEGNMDQDFYVGKWTFWHENGVKAAEGLYGRGLPSLGSFGFNASALISNKQGKWMEWYDNAQVICDVGNNGEFVWYHPNGKKFQEYKKHGPHIAKQTRWDEFGKIEEETYYFDNKLNRSIDYENGKPVKTHMYNKDDQPIEEKSK